MLMEKRSRRCASGEEQAINIGLEQCAACLPSALDDIQNTVGKARILGKIQEKIADARRKLAWFEDDCIPG